MSGDVLIYSIDGVDTIAGVDANWRSFAEDNCWRSGCGPEEVVGRSLWDFIQDYETRFLYQELFRRLRAGRRCPPLPFRCDSPAEKRFLELSFEPLPEGGIELGSRTVRTERREPVPLLEAGTPRSGESITICSMCKKIRVAEEEWAEIEEGLALLGIFAGDAMPWLSHGLCPACYRSAVESMD
ncbi:MAG: hypothetical protein JXP48_04340 [Acidobacteria bacterium]|nr:hypothetical protein [Acidobacteriota bacterium]